MNFQTQGRPAAMSSNPISDGVLLEIEKKKHRASLVLSIYVARVLKRVNVIFFSTRNS